MPRIFISCPVGGQPIDTGVETDEASFPRLPRVLGKAFCVHCGTEHEWTRDKAWLVDGDKPKS